MMIPLYIYDATTKTGMRRSIYMTHILVSQICKIATDFKRHPVSHYYQAVIKFIENSENDEESSRIFHITRKQKLEVLSTNLDRLGFNLTDLVPEKFSTFHEIYLYFVSVDVNKTLENGRVLHLFKDLNF